MHHNRALPFASDLSPQTRVLQGTSAVGISFTHFNRRENRRPLAIFGCKEVSHLGALNIARCCGGAVKIAAATAENRDFGALRSVLPQAKALLVIIHQALVMARRVP